VLLFDRRLGNRTPGPFRTRVIIKGVDPILTCYYKSSKIKQYFKEGWALRTETVICDTRDFRGFTNRDLVGRVCPLLEKAYTHRQATYDLRRLRRKGLVARVPRSRRYQLTDLGRRVAVLFTKTYVRVLAPGLIMLDPRLPQDLAARSPLATAWRRLARAIEEFIDAELVAA